MSTTGIIDTLNRVFAILQRSFPQYMIYSRPYVPAGRGEVMATVRDIVAGQNALAERISQQITAADGVPDPGDFPIVYTDTHDLAIDFLIREAISEQKRDIADLETCVEALRTSPAGQSLAAEALGMARGHLELLEALQNKAGQSTVVRENAPAYAHDMPVSNEQTGTPHRQEERKLAAGDPHSPA